MLAISWELRRQIGSRVKLKLQNDIEKNPGPEIEKEMKRRRECQRRKRQEKLRRYMEKRVEMMASKTKVMTWNAQKAYLDYPRSCRFVEMLKYVRKTSAKIVFSELLGLARPAVAPHSAVVRKEMLSISPITLGTMVNIAFVSNKDFPC